MAKRTYAQDLLEVFEQARAKRLTLVAITAAVRCIRGQEIPQATIRCQLQRRCSTCKQYNGIEDLFRNPSPGIWQLR